MWTSFSPVQVTFGRGALEKVGEVSRRYNRSVALVTGGSAVRTGVAGRVQTLLDAAGVRWEAYSGVTADPKLEEVDAVVDRVRSEKLEGIVVVGGGSAMDCAKAAAVVIAGGGSCEEYLAGERPLPLRGAPLVAVPTTAGTGAELSRGAIITWTARNRKAGLRGDCVMPTACVVDPLLTRTASPRQTAINGFDAFAHATETFMSRKATPVTRILSREAIIAVHRHLPRLMADLDDVEARTQMSLHAMLMGYNLANASTCLPHRMQYPLGVETGTEHALGLAALYPAWMGTTYEASPAAFDTVAGWMAEGQGVKAQPGREGLLELLEQFRVAIDLAPSLSDLGADEAMVVRMAGNVTGGVESDPWWADGRDLQTLYRNALSHPKEAS